jgi:hypothetical protein
MKLLAAAGDSGSTIAGIRLATPLSALCAADGHGLRLRSFHDCTAADLTWADVFVAQRPLEARAWRLQDGMRRSGGRVVVEIDDLLTDMPDALLGAARVRAGQPWLQRSLRSADAVSASTARLAEALAPLSPRVGVVPNHGAGEAAVPRVGAAAVTLLFVSSDHVPVAGVAGALQALAARRPGVELLAIGPVADDLRRHGLEPAAVPPMPREAFAGWLRALPDALAVIPVGDTAFDRCKSAIKFFDYALAGIPVLCAARPPYSDVVRHGSTAWCVAEDSAAAWQAALLHLLGAPALREQLARGAAAQVQAGHTLAHSVAAWRSLLAPLPARTGPPRAPWPAWQRAVESVQFALRQANRRRLAARQQQRR